MATTTPTLSTITTPTGTSAFQKLLYKNLEDYLYMPVNKQTMSAITNTATSTLNNYISINDTGTSATTTKNTIWDTEYSIYDRNINLKASTTYKYVTADNGTSTITDTNYFKFPERFVYEYDTNGQVLASENVDWGKYVYHPVPEDKKDMHRRRIRSQLIVPVRSRAQLPHSIPENERVAMETLREMISEAEFRKYLKHGFVLVPGKSGKTYQVFRNQAHTRVWKGGKLVEEVCVRIASSANCPPTDNVVAFMAMIGMDEEEFRKAGNVYPMLKAA